MQLKFFQVLSFMTMFFVIVHTAGQHNDCFDYDKVNEEGLNLRKIFRKCGFIDNRKVHTDPDAQKCISRIDKEMNEDGSVNRNRVISLVKQFTYPEYMDPVLALTKNALKQPPKKMFKYFAEELAKICPKDSFYGN